MELLVRDLFERAAEATRRSLRVQSRALEATRRAVRVQSRAVVVVAVIRTLRAGRLVIQCAWCGRVSDDGEQWEHVRSVALRPEQVTGSICDACLAANTQQPTTLTRGGRDA